MIIKLTPIKTVKRLSASKQGDTLILNGEAFDFSQLQNGDTLPVNAIDSEWIVGSVIKENDEIEVTLLLPHGENAPEETRFPEDVQMSGDGEVPLPPYEETP